MAIENRDLGTAQQRDLFSVNIGALATGATAALLVVPYPANLIAGAVAATGVSNVPTLTLEVTRYNTAGVTTLGSIAAALTVVGATVPVSFTMNTGASAVQLQRGDIVVAREGGTNANVTSAAIVLVTRCLQDLKTTFGV